MLEIFSCKLDDGVLWLRRRDHRRIGHRVPSLAVCSYLGALAHEPRSVAYVARRMVPRPSEGVVETAGRLLADRVGMK